MLNKLLFLCALISLTLGIFHIYRPNLILRLNRFMRDEIFSDRHVQFKRIKWGLFYMVIGAAFLYTIFHRSHYTNSKVTQNLLPVEWLVYQSLQHLYAEEYIDARMLAQKALDRDPDNADALYQMGAAHILLKDTQAGMAYWTRAARVDSASLRGARIREFVERVKTKEAAANRPAVK